MTNAILRGRSYAGNPHVRFDEGEVASAKPRRGSLLYRRVLLFSLLVSLSAGAVEFYVSPQGDDATTGSAERPFRSLAQARDAARTAAKPVRIVLADGLYTTDEPLVFTAQDRQLEIVAEKGARPVVSAGWRVTGWTVDGKGVWHAPVPKGDPFRAVLRERGAEVKGMRKHMNRLICVFAVLSRRGDSAVAVCGGKAYKSIGNKETGGMDRWQFLGGFGGLVATAALPSFADDPSMFPKRGRFERLSVAYARIDAGATAPFSVMHISDTHLTAAYLHEGVAQCGMSARRTQTFGGRQEAALRDSLDWAKANCDYVLHTGDLIDFQSEANFDLVKKHYGETMFGSMGNHEFYTYLPDEKHTWLESFKDRSWPILKERYPVDARFSAKVVNGVNFICLDDVFGTVRPDQVEKFHLEAKKGLPIVLCMHVPFFTDTLWLMTRRFWSSPDTKFRRSAMPDPSGDLKRQREDRTTADFIAYLKSERLLKGLLVGHEHVTMQDRFSETAMEYAIGGNYMFDCREVLFT